MDKFKSSRTLSIIGASLERMIVVLAGGVYISKVGTYVGLSTSQNGFLNVFLQFGASFQLIAIFFAGKVSQKKFVIFTVIFSMLMFGLVYLVPFLRFLGGAITLVLTIVLLLAYAFQNISNSPKYSWAYSLVDNSKKGIYTANRERIGTVVSLVFTFFVGIIIDYF